MARLESEVFEVGPDIFGETYWRVAIKNPLVSTISHSFLFLEKDIADNYAEFLNEAARFVKEKMRNAEQTWELTLEDVRTKTRGLVVGS